MQSEKRHLTCVKLLDVKLTKRTASFVVREKYRKVKIFINAGFSKITNPLPVLPYLDEGIYLIL